MEQEGPKKRLLLDGEIKVVPVADITDNPLNPKNATQKQLDKLRTSFQTLGYILPIVVNKELKLIDGHQRMKNIRADKVDEVEVLVVDVKDEEELLAILVTNSIYGKFDQDKKQDIINILEEKGVDLASILANYGQEHSRVDFDEITRGKVLDVPDSIEYGQVVRLGRHYLICGDSTDPEVWSIISETLSKDKLSPYMVLTSPPYYNQRDYSTWTSIDSYLADMEKALNYAGAMCNPDMILFLNIRQDLEGPIASLLASRLYAGPYKYLQNIAWVENGAPLHSTMRHSHIRTHNIYYTNFMWENIFVFQKGERHRFDPHDVKEISANYITDVWNIQQERAKDVGHPAPFPIDLARAGVICYTAIGDVVIDPFVGSGTTLLACEETGRVGVGVELEPEYCKLAIKRYNEFVGKEIDERKRERKGGSRGPGYNGPAPDEEEQEAD